MLLRNGTPADFDPLGPFAKLRKVTVSFVMSVRPRLSL